MISHYVIILCICILQGREYKHDQKTIHANPNSSARHIRRRRHNNIQSSRQRFHTDRPPDRLIRRKLLCERAYDLEKADISSENGLLAAESSDDSMYMQMSLDADTSDDSSLEQYVYSYIQSIAQKSDDSEQQTTVVSPVRKKINGHSGYYFELSSTSGGVDIYLWCFCFENSSGVVHIDVSSPKNDAGTNADVAEGIINSVKEK